VGSNKQQYEENQMWVGEEERKSNALLITFPCLQRKEKSHCSGK